MYADTLSSVSSDIACQQESNTSRSGMMSIKSKAHISTVSEELSQRIEFQRSTFLYLC